MKLTAVFFPIWFEIFHHVDKVCVDFLETRVEDSKGTRDIIGQLRCVQEKERNIQEPRMQQTHRYLPWSTSKNGINVLISPQTQQEHNHRRIRGLIPEIPILIRDLSRHLPSNSPIHVSILPEPIYNQHRIQGTIPQNKQRRQKAQHRGEEPCEDSLDCGGSQKPTWRREVVIKNL